VGFANGQLQSIFRLGHDDKMHVVGHQTIGPDQYIMEGAPLSQLVEVVTVIVIGKKSG
jgi:hypothetical protein